MPTPIHNHKPSATAGTISKVVKRINLRAISSNRASSACEPGSTMAKLTKMRGK